MDGEGLERGNRGGRENLGICFLGFLGQRFWRGGRRRLERLIDKGGGSARIRGGRDGFGLSRLRLGRRRRWRRGGRGRRGSGGSGPLPRSGSEG